MSTLIQALLYDRPMQGKNHHILSVILKADDSHGNTVTNLAPRLLKKSCSTQLSTSMKFQFLMKTKMLKNKDLSCVKTLRCCIYPAHKCLNANNCWHFNIYEQDKFHA